MIGTGIELIDLTRRYGRHTAVADLSLAIRGGEIFGLLGPNGAGKTTTISMIAGVLTPSAGAVRVGGHDVVADRYAARALLGFVPQELALYEPLDARDNLRFFGGLYGLRGRALRERVDWALELAGLGERAHEPVKQFSGGMKRRLNLAAGLLHRPRVLVLDEPTAGVDPQSRAHIFECLEQLRANDGLTVIYTSHYLEEIEALCDRVGILDHGRLIALDAVQDLIRAHAGGGLELELVGDVDAGARLLAPLGEAVVHHGCIHLRTSCSLGEVVRRAEEAGARVLAARQLGADLESVFLSLTGHSLRDV